MTWQAHLSKNIFYSHLPLWLHSECPSNADEIILTLKNIFLMFSIISNNIKGLTPSGNGREISIFLFGKLILGREVDIWSFKNIFKISSTHVYFLTEHEVALACVTFAYLVGSSREHKTPVSYTKKIFCLSILPIMYWKNRKYYEFLIHFLVKCGVLRAIMRTKIAKPLAIVI